MPAVVGSRIREARTNHNLSLNEVAVRAHISVATLSRIERDKQGLDLSLFLLLCKILKTAPNEVLGSDDGENVDPLSEQIGRLKHDERLQLWRDLAVARRSDRRRALRSNVQRLHEQVEELLAQLQFVQSEIEVFRGDIGKR